MPINLDHLKANFETVIKSQEIHRGSFLRYRHDTVRDPAGVERSRDILEHPGGATVMGFLPNGKVLLIAQYRHALGDILLEFPAGKLEPEEPPHLTIQRELEEETGYQAEYWEKVSRIIPAPGFCNEVIWVYKASGLKKSPNPRRCEDEFIEILEVSAEDIRELIKGGQLIDAKTLAAIALISPEWLLEP